MPRKLSKAGFRPCPPEGTVEFEKWKRNITTGIRKAKRKRREAGLLSLTEVAVMHQLPMRFVKLMAAEGRLPVLQAGCRRYVREDVAEAILGKPGSRSAA